MTVAIDVVARVFARERRRVVPVRSTSVLAPDPLAVFGIAPIRVVAEQRVQAIAFGLLGEEPSLVVNWNPLGREAGCLEPFAEALDGYLRACLRNDMLPRVWLPHAAALETVELLGHRYRYNKHVTDAIRRMGWQCRELTHEATFDGQQTVAIASALLTGHFVTGQSPLEDLNLGAFLAWANPSPGVDPIVEAERRALVPAAAMLERKDDDRVEALRQIANETPDSARGRSARHEIEALLGKAARSEWALLVEAHEAFWGLGLSTDRNYEPLVDASLYRVRFALENDYRAPSRPHSLSRLLDSYEHAIELADDADVRADGAVRERQRRAGRVFPAMVVNVDQPRRNFLPCRLTITTDQAVLRVRKGTGVSTMDGAVVGKVVSVGEAEGGQQLVVDVTKGVRASTLPGVGDEVEWSTTSVFAPWIKNKVFQHIAESTTPLIVGNALPAGTPRQGVDVDLLGLTETLRKYS
jgi:hypothetical protein